MLETKMKCKAAPPTGGNTSESQANTTHVLPSPPLASFAFKGHSLLFFIYINIYVKTTADIL